MDKKNNTNVKDEQTLVPLLHDLGKITDLESAKTKAVEFLNSCRFNEEKVAKLKMAVNETTNLKKLNLLCWNTLLSGEGSAVVK